MVSTVQCERRILGDVLADRFVSPWPELSAIPLVETSSGNPPEQRTWFKVAWCAAELRLLMHASDTHIWATHTQRDAPLYDEEVMEVFLTPWEEEGEPRRYFEIEVNPLNTVLDLALRRTPDGFERDFAWSCKGLRTAVKIEEGAWTAEFSIPFASVDALPLQRYWRANFFRIDRPKDKPRELSAWSPTYDVTFHRPDRFGRLEFVSG